MGKNSYLGGGTILHAGSGFFSKNKSIKRNRTVSAEQDFLVRCIQAELSGKGYPKNYIEHEKLRTRIANSGGVSEWLKTHPDYMKVRDDELKRAKKKEEKKRKKKERRALVKQKQAQEANERKQKKTEKSYLEDFIWSQIVGREPPSSKPKGFDEKYPLKRDLLDWAQSHELYGKTYATLLSKRKKQIKRMEQSKQIDVEVVIKKKRFKALNNEINTTKD